MPYELCLKSRAFGYGPGRSQALKLMKTPKLLKHTPISHQTRIVKSVQNEAIMFKGSLCRIQLIDRSVGLDVLKFTRSENKTENPSISYIFTIRESSFFGIFALFPEKNLIWGFSGIPIPSQENPCRIA